MNYILELLIVAVYDLALLAGCSYLVFWRGESAWWFLLVVLLFATASSKETHSK